MKNLTKNEVKEINGAAAKYTYIEVTVKNNEDQSVPLVIFDRGIPYDEQDKVFKEMILEPLKNMAKKDTKHPMEYHDHE